MNEQTIVLPSGTELTSGNVFLIDPANHEILQKTGRGTLRIPILRWLIAFFSAAVSVFCVYLVLDELPRTGVDAESITLAVSPCSRRRFPVILSDCST